MELPEFLTYLTEKDLEPKPITELPEILDYLQKEDITTTPLENIIKMTKNYLNYENPLLYKLFLHYNPHLPEDKVKMVEEKIKELLELEKTKNETIYYSEIVEE